MPKGFVYLFAVIDWYSRYVLSWRFSTTLETGFCLEGLEEALVKASPKSSTPIRAASSPDREFTGRLQSAGITISMDGQGRALDNIFVERLWRTVKYEDVYLRAYDGVEEARQSIGRYIAFYNEVLERP